MHFEMITLCLSHVQLKTCGFKKYDGDMSNQ